MVYTSGLPDERRTEDHDRARAGPAGQHDPLGAAAGREEDVAGVILWQQLVGELVLNHRRDLLAETGLGPDAAVELGVQAFERPGVEVVADLLQVRSDPQHVDDLGAPVVETGPLLHADDLSHLDGIGIAGMRRGDVLADERARVVGLGRPHPVIEGEVRLDLALVRLDRIDVLVLDGLLGGFAHGIVPSAGRMGYQRGLLYDTGGTHRSSYRL